MKLLKIILLIIMLSFFESAGRALQRSVHLADIPKDVISACLDSRGRTADIGEEWRNADLYEGDNAPHSALLVACKYDSEAWYIACDKGSYTPIHKRYFARLIAKHWSFISIKNERKDAGAACPKSDNDSL